MRGHATGTESAACAEKIRAGNVESQKSMFGNSDFQCCPQDLTARVRNPEEEEEEEEEETIYI